MENLFCQILNMVIMKKFDIDYSARFNKKQVELEIYTKQINLMEKYFGDTPYIKRYYRGNIRSGSAFSSDTEG